MCASWFLYSIHMLWILGHYELPLLLEYVTSPEQCVVVGKQDPLNESVDHQINRSTRGYEWKSVPVEPMIFISTEFTWCIGLMLYTRIEWRYGRKKQWDYPVLASFQCTCSFCLWGLDRIKKKNPPFRFRLDWFTSYLCQEWRWASSVLSVTHLDLSGHLLLLGEASEAPTGSAPVSRSQ